MKTIICKFKSEGADIRKVAILNDSLDELSKSKKNEATDIYDYDIGEWSIYFGVSDTLGYEVDFKCDDETGEKTLVAVRAVTWGGDDAGVVIDSQLVNVTVR